jgi:hypothetical protein
MSSYKLLFAALVALLALAASETVFAQGEAPSYYVANTSPPDAFLALKTYPSPNGPRIMAMANGTRLDVLLRRTDGWWYVRVWPGGEQGWAFSGNANKAYILCCASGGGASATLPPAKSMTDFSCEQLWFGRNSIFKEAGYCFKTSRAISTFGNAGCRYDDINQVVLTPENRNFVETIEQTERLKTCQQ